MATGVQAWSRFFKKKFNEFNELNSLVPLWFQIKFRLKLIYDRKPGGVQFGLQHFNS